jgi:hypothetical protein
MSDRQFRQPFAEQLAALRIRTANLVPTERWTDLMRGAHDRAFVVAGAMAADLLQDFATAVEQVVAEGKSLDWFRENFDSIVDRHGWAYTGERNWRSRVIYVTNMRTTYARPVVVSVTPDKSLAFGSVPDQPYVITAEYYSRPIDFTSDTDQPSIPARFQLMIVYRAMMFYAGYEAAPEVYARGEQEFKRLMNRLEIDQLETVVSGPPLA